MPPKTALLSLALVLLGSLLAVPRVRAQQLAAPSTPYAAGPRIQESCDEIRWDLEAQKDELHDMKSEYRRLRPWWMIAGFVTAGVAALAGAYTLIILDESNDLGHLALYRAAGGISGVVLVPLSIGIAGAVYRREHAADRAQLREYLNGEKLAYRAAREAYVQQCR